MSQSELDRFFEQVLAEPQDGQDANAVASRATLASALLGTDSAQETGEAGGTATLAASLDSYDLDAVQCFLDRMSAQTLPVPPDLVAAMTGDGALESRRPAVAAPRGRNVPRWGWAAGAMAAALLLAVFAGMRQGVQSTAHVAGAAVPSGVASLQGPDRSNVGVVSPPPPKRQPERSDVLVDGTAFNDVVPTTPAPAKPKGGTAKIAEPTYTSPNPPVALTSHAVTADDYPPASVRLQEQGSVQLKYTIQADGNVGDCILTMTSGFPRLDEAACILVKKWKFKPATVIGGSPVAVTVPAEIVYALAPVNPSPASRGEQFLFDGLMRRHESPQ